MGIDQIKRAVFLDRDGVINRPVVRQGKPYPPDNLAELEILPDVPEALVQLKAAGFELVIVTNQPDVARGKQNQTEVEAMHHFISQQLPIDDVRVCYHDNADNCHCRKPLPGMLLDAAQERQIDLTTSYMVGDRWRDIEAGRQAGCTTILIDYHYDEAELSPPHARVSSLGEAAEWILKQHE